MSPTSLLLSLVLALAGGEAFAQAPVRAGSVAPAGEGPRLGVALTVARDRLEVSMVEEGGAADRAGLRVGDFVLEVGGRPLEPGGTGYRALIEALDGLDPTASLELVVARGGQRTPLTVEFGPAPPAGSAFLGCSVRDGERGALIEGVEPGSPAERAGLLEGDELLALAGVEIDGIVALLERLGEHRPGERVQLLVGRDGDSLLFDLELAERPRAAAERATIERGRAPSAVGGTPPSATAALSPETPAPSSDAPAPSPETPAPSPETPAPSPETPAPSSAVASRSPDPASAAPAVSEPQPPFDAAGFEAALDEVAETLSSALEGAVERLADRIESAIEAAAEASSGAAETAELLERERARRAAAEERLARVEAELAELRAELARVRADLQGIGRALWGDGR